jgi:hypothetical protein
MYRVVQWNNIVPFNKYSDALAYKQENGGSIYMLAYSQQYGRKN